MQDTRKGNPTSTLDDSRDAPPRPSHRAALAATVLLGLLWLVLTFAADWVAPGIGGVLEWGEVSLGLDVSMGERTLEDSE